MADSPTLTLVDDQWPDYGHESLVPISVFVLVLSTEVLFVCAFVFLYINT